MSKLDKLIQQLCPEGVEWQTLNDIGEFFGGLTGKSKNDFIDGNAAFITYSNIYSNPSLNLNIDEKVRIDDGEKQNVIQYGDILFTGSSETPDECGMSSVVTKEPTEKMYLNSFCFGLRLFELDKFNFDYLKHLFRSAEIRKEICKTANGVTRYNISKKKMGEIAIPLPPIPVQEKIVRILDTFIASISNLKEQIKERRKQYEYYRNQLLDFEGKEGVEMKTLGEVCDVKNGYTPSTKNADFWEEGNIPWFTLEDIRKNGRILSDAVKHITPLGVKKNGLFPKDSIIVSTTATIGEHALILVDFMCNQQITCISINNKFKNHIGVKFLYYLGNAIGEWCRRNVNGGGGLSIVSTSKLKQYAIPIPAKEEQLRIVTILDQFEASIANLELQLKQREKQYEYYRNQLLDFKKKED